MKYFIRPEEIGSFIYSNRISMAKEPSIGYISEYGLLPMFTRKIIMSDAPKQALSCR